MFSALGSVFKMFTGSSSKLSEIYNQVLVGQLFKKRVGENPKSISKECMMKLSAIDEATFDYCLSLSNNVKS